jgi:tRNA(adenine34) deaminase
MYSVCLDLQCTKVQIIMERIDRKDDFFMRMAINEASAALKKGEVPIGAVVVCGDRVVGRGHNLTESLGDATAHAEMQAITAAAASLGGKYLDKCTLYVTVEPCIMCSGAIILSRIKRVIFGAYDPKGGALISSINVLDAKNINHRPEIIPEILMDECSQIIKNYFKEKRKLKLG